MEIFWKILQIFYQNFVNFSMIFIKFWTLLRRPGVAPPPSPRTPYAATPLQAPYICGPSFPWKIFLQALMVSALKLFNYDSVSISTFINSKLEIFWHWSFLFPWIVLLDFSDPIWEFIPVSQFLEYISISIMKRNFPRSFALKALK